MFSALHTKKEDGAETKNCRNDEQDKESLHVTHEQWRKILAPLNVKDVLVKVKKIIEKGKYLLKRDKYLFFFFFLFHFSRFF